MKTVFIKTFGCAQNTADSERIKTYFKLDGFTEVEDVKKADVVVINSCIVRESAENRVYGLINQISKGRNSPLTPLLTERGTNKQKIIVTGCLVGLYDKKGKINQLKRKMPDVDEFLPIEKISFDLEPIRNNKKAALITISSGCNNFCSYCIVPMARGREISRSMEEILKEIDKAIKSGFKEVVLIGQNVNSFSPSKSPFDPPEAGRQGDLKNIVSMGKKRFQSLFPKLLEEVAKKSLEKVSFVSSNPWDFSDELIDVIAKYPNIDRLIHLPFQSGDNEILKRMNRGYTKNDYLGLVRRIKARIKDVRISTDIIIGFPGEDEKAFQNTVDVCKQVGFEIAYLNKYSPRSGTVSAKLYKDDIPQSEKKRRWNVLNELVNKT